MNKEAESYQTLGMRESMVRELKNSGISDLRVLDAMRKVKRHLFFPSAFLQYAYQNRAFAIAAEQTISHPYTVAFQTMLLGVKPGHRILEIGTGSGYQTCVLRELGAIVFSIERQKELFDLSSRQLRALGYHANLYFGDGFKGLPTYAPYDGILVTCGAPDVPEALLKQLKTGGRLIVPVGTGSKQVMTELLRIGPTEVSRRTHGNFSFVPMLADKSNSINVPPATKWSGYEGSKK